MKYENTKIGVYVFIVLLIIGCTNQTKQQECISNQEEKKIAELLKQDTAYLKEITLITSKEKTIKDKQYAILLNIVSIYIKANYYDIQEHDGLNCDLPMTIMVNQGIDYKENNIYYISWGGTGMSYSTFTNIAKIQDRYVFFQLHNEKHLPKEVLPKMFLKDCKQEKTVFVINELSWVVLMCKNSIEHIVLKNIVSIEDEECIEYFDGFPSGASLSDSGNLCPVNKKIKTKKKEEWKIKK